MPSLKTSYGWLVVFWSMFGLAHVILALDFSEVTSSVGLGLSRGSVSALADFNGDRLTDLFIVNDTGIEHSLYLWNGNIKSFHHTYLTLDTPLPILRVGVADFDGDGVTDIVSFSNTTETGDCCLATIHWCRLRSDGTIAVSGNLTLDEHLTGYPLVLDYNGDHLADLAGVTREGDYVVWISDGMRDFSSPKRLLSRDGYKVHSSYFVDLSSDCIPELLVFVSSDSTYGFLLLNGDPREEMVALPLQLQPSAVLGVPLVADMDADGQMEVVLFSCYDSDCLHTAVHVLLLKKFPGSDVLHCQADKDWKLEFISVVTVNLTQLLRPTMLEEMRPSVGDINLDGFPDILVPAVSNNTKSYPLLLLGGNHDNKLRPQPLSEPRFANTTQAMFFDLGEDGIPDLLLVQDGGGGGGVGGVGGVGGGERVTAYRQTLNTDHTFLKVLILSRHCFSLSCADEAYTSALPGATVSFSTTDRNGHKELGVATVRGNGDSPLQLPFVLFGLGETPNFVESLTIGVGYSLPPSNMSSRRTSYKEWSLLVPNSQVVVLTQHPDDSGSWKLELYLTPSHLVYSTAGVLAATAVVLATIIALLQAREKYQDSQERKQAKHKFHFNAM